MQLYHPVSGNSGHILQRSPIAVKVLILLENFNRF